MTRDDKTEIRSEKASDYAFWAVPGALAAVMYSLPVFHEIDFAVNEGYRKIPHGGIEEGGLLFGKIDPRGTSIEAFRPIQCEHASGPSFLLSEHDLQVLTEQIAGAAADPELAGLEVVGWFLAHTRGPLALTDKEFELFERFFKKPGMLTLLVKPERFQPTRFGFLVRGPNGVAPRDASHNAVILPLSGRSAKSSNGPVSSIPAPAAKEEPPAAAGEPETTAAKPAEKTPENRSTRRQRRFNANPPLSHEAESQESADSGIVAGGPAGGADPESESEPVWLSSLVGSSPPGALGLRDVPHHAEDYGPLLDPYQQIELLQKKKAAGTTARLVMVLPMAALFGCVVGYLAYLQVPSPLIPLQVKSRGQTVLVTWPADQTRSAVYAAVRVDDSTPVMLTPEERNAGRVEVTATADMKVELIARNWIHDSRGIVRYVKPLANTAP